MDRSELSQLAMPIARKLAARKFEGHPDREQLTADAESTAWEFAQTAGPDATPSTVAWYATKSVAGERRFAESVRSIDHPSHRGLRKRVSAVDFANDNDDPYLIVQAKLDSAAWFRSLTGLHKFVAQLYASNWTTGKIAKRLRKSQARISQIRKELRQSYADFTNG